MLDKFVSHIIIVDEFDDDGQTIIIHNFCVPANLDSRHQRNGERRHAIQHLNLLVVPITASFCANHVVYCRRFGSGEIC